MLIKVVPSKDISTKSLRASDYVLSPKHEAEALTKGWRRDNGLEGLIHARAAAMRDLERRIIKLVQRALEEK